MYLIAAGVGLGPSQYQWTVLRLTSLAQVHSSGLDLEKILLRKLNSSRSICGPCRTVKKKMDVKSTKEFQTNREVIKKREREREREKKAFIYYMTSVYRTDLICPKSYQRACAMSPLDDTSNRRPLGRSNGYSSPY